MSCSTPFSEGERLKVTGVESSLLLLLHQGPRTLLKSQCNPTLFPGPLRKDDWVLCCVLRFPFVRHSKFRNVLTMERKWCLLRGRPLERTVCQPQESFTTKSTWEETEITCSSKFVPRTTIKSPFNYHNETLIKLFWLPVKCFSFSRVFIIPTLPSSFLPRPLDSFVTL